MNKIQKYTLRLDEYHTLLIHEDDYIHKRPCEIITHKYNMIVALYNKDKDFAKVFLISTKIDLAYILRGNSKAISNLIEREVVEVCEGNMVHSLEREDDGDIKIREIYSELLIGKAIHREHAQMIFDKI